MQKETKTVELKPQSSGDDTLDWMKLKEVMLQIITKYEEAKATFELAYPEVVEQFKLKHSKKRR